TGPLAVRRPRRIGRQGPPHLEGLTMDLRGNRSGRKRVVAGARLALLLAGVGLLGPHARAATEPSRVTEVKVERVRPPKEKLPTLQFLRANRDFIRGRYDRLVQTPIASRDADVFDPRFLNYADLLNQIHASQDTLGQAEDQRSRRHL